jgi:RHS repeat-associated protein
VSYVPGSGTYISAPSNNQLYLQVTTGTFIQLSNPDLKVDYYTAEIVKSTEYSCYGVELSGWGYVSVDSYRYGFNGQEKEKEITGSETHTSAEFWMYDSRLGRRWQLDPVVQTFISDYACFGNNPIKMNDVLGNKFGDPQSETNAKNAEVFADRRIRQANKILSKQGKKLFLMDEKLSKLEERGKVDSEKYIKLSAKRQEVSDVMDQQIFFSAAMNKSKRDIQEMREHEQVFILEYMEDGDLGIGATYYDLSRNACVMSFTDMASMFDELVAGSQFIQGEISFDSKTGGIGVLTDLDDERESYLRSWAADPRQQRKNLKPEDIKIQSIYDITEDDGTRPYRGHSKTPKNMKTHGKEAAAAGDIYWPK